MTPKDFPLHQYSYSYADKCCQNCIYHDHHKIKGFRDDFCNLVMKFCYGISCPLLFYDLDEHKYRVSDVKAMYGKDKGRLEYY